MKRKILSLVVLFSVLACDRPETYVSPDVEVPVVVEEIALKPIEEFVVATGTVNATVDAVVKSEIQGFYRLGINSNTSRPFALGDYVKKDQVIISLENPEQENQIKFESIELSLKNAKDDYELLQSLRDKGGAPENEVKKAQQTLLNAQYSYESALMQLSKFKITSPFDGLIVDIPYYTPGLEVPANSEMFHIMDYNTLNMEVNLPGKLLGEINVNQRVRVISYMIPDKNMNGVITQVSPTLEPTTRTFKATLDINNKDLLLRPGMFVKAEIITTSKENAIVIPKDIILVRRTNKIVYVVTQNIARQRIITTGLENPDIVEVTNGLSVNELLVIEGFETLQNGSKVEMEIK